MPCWLVTALGKLLCQQCPPVVNLLPHRQFFRFIRLGIDAHLRRSKHFADLGQGNLRNAREQTDKAVATRMRTDATVGLRNGILGLPNSNDPNF